MNFDRNEIGLQLAGTLKIFGKEMHMAFNKSDLNITIEQFVVLNALNNHENLTQQDLAVMFSKDKSGILRTIDGLEKKKLVVRITDDLDKRKKILMLTKPGVETLKKLIELEMNTFQNLLKNIPDQNLQILSETLLLITKEYSKNTIK